MDLQRLLLTAHGILAECKCAHGLIGAFGMSLHGVQRATNDVDFLVDGRCRVEVENRFLKSGFTVFHQSGEVLQLTGPDGAVDLLFANRPMSQDMLHRKELPAILGVPCLIAEDIIGLKIQSFMNNSKRKLKEQADIQALIESNRELDWTLIKKYADVFDVWPEIQSIRKAAAP